MTDRERLLKILNVPIYPHENVDPLEAVADYLLDNGVRLPVLCKDCKHYDNGGCGMVYGEYEPNPNDYCSYGERKYNE